MNKIEVTDDNIIYFSMKTKQQRYYHQTIKNYSCEKGCK